WGAGRGTVAHPPERTQAALAPAPRCRRLLPRPRRLRFADQGGLGTLLRRGRHRPRLGLPTDAMDRGYGRQLGTDNGGCVAANRAPAPDRLGPLDGSTAATLGRYSVGVRRTGGQLRGSPRLLGSHWRPV